MATPAVLAFVTGHKVPADPQTVLGLVQGAGALAELFLRADAEHISGREEVWR